MCVYMHVPVTVKLLLSGVQRYGHLPQLWPLEPFSKILKSGYGIEDLRMDDSKYGHPQEAGCQDSY